MSRDMTITVTCDGKGCSEELDIDLQDGNILDDYDTRIETGLEWKNWYSDYSGDYCPKCSTKAKARYREGTRL